MSEPNERHVAGPSDVPEGATGYMIYADGKPHGPFKPGKQRVRFVEPSSQYARMGRCLEPECKACNGEPSRRVNATHS